jgi:hypothetical protein
VHVLFLLTVERARKSFSSFTVFVMQHGIDNLSVIDTNAPDATLSLPFVCAAAGPYLLSVVAHQVSHISATFAG